MKIANVSTVKNNLSKFLEYVKRGGTVRIMDRALAIAEIVPLSESSAEPSDLLADLEAQGLVVRKRKPLSKNLYGGLGKKPSGVLDSLLTERDEGR